MRAVGHGLLLGLTVLMGLVGFGALFMGIVAGSSSDPEVAGWIFPVLAWGVWC